MNNNLNQMNNNLKNNINMNFNINNIMNNMNNNINFMNNNMNFFNSNMNNKNFMNNMNNMNLNNMVFNNIMNNMNIKNQNNNNNFNSNLMNNNGFNNNNFMMDFSKMNNFNQMKLLNFMSMNNLKNGFQNNMVMNQNNNNNKFNLNNNNNNNHNLSNIKNISSNGNNDILEHQKILYNYISSKNFKLSPIYTTNFNIQNLNISENNKSLLEKISKTTKYFPITPLDIIYKEQYGIFNKTTKEREKCPICLYEFYDDILEDNPQNLKLKNIEKYISHEIDSVILFKCQDHFYHIECLYNYIQEKEGFKCVICQKIYGILKGNMPPGKMKVYLNKHLRCAGYKEETIVIQYSFNSGQLNDGTYYMGTSRTSYLPNNKEGREILGMLKIAFDRKFTFVVGTSVTTGQKNTVVWNGIHHKTSTTGGPTNYGYPDPKYFNRVTEELASKGINKSEFKNGELEGIAIKLLYK